MTAHISPTVEDFEEVRAIVSTGIKDAAKAYPMERSPTVELGWGGEEFIVTSLDGASGFTSYPNRIEIEFNTTASQWRESLRSTTVHEYAHVFGYDHRQRESETKWEYILEEAFTQHVAEQLVPEYQSPWWTKYNPETVAKYWGDIVVDELEDPSEDGGPLYIDPQEEQYPLGLGYSLSYQLGEELLTDIELPALLTLDRELLVRAGDELYRDGQEDSV